MDSVSPGKVLEAFDKEAEKYKKYSSSYRRIMNVRRAVQKEIEKESQSEICEPIDSVTAASQDFTVTDFPKSSERIAAMIKDADEREMW